MSNDIEVAVYYFPEYHADARNDKWHGKGWTEWELMKAARPRFEGHRQPKVPAWGYFDESDPQWAAKEIDLAADSGITAFGEKIRPVGQDCVESARQEVERESQSGQSAQDGQSLG